jgi:hypothetical protein
MMMAYLIMLPSYHDLNLTRSCHPPSACASSARRCAAPCAASTPCHSAASRARRRHAEKQAASSPRV